MRYDRSQAIILRRQGMSYKDITGLLGIPGVL